MSPNNSNFIDVKIPWLPEKRLGEAYNIAASTVAEWVIFLDADVFLYCNKDWHSICLRTIQKYPDAGLISCVTNRIGCPTQKCPAPDDTDDITRHIAHAYDVESLYAGQVQDVTESQWKLSGFFMMIHKKTLDEIGEMPPEKFLGVDNWIHDRVKETGKRIYIMRDLYVYHGYKRQWKT